MLEFGFSRLRLNRAIIKEYDVVIWYSILGFSIRVIGISIMVVQIIFNIIVDLSFLGSRFHGFV